MGRAILAVIVGYVALAVFVMVTFALLYLALGTEQTFQPGSYSVSTTWIVISTVLGFVAAIVGGLVCARIAPRPRPLYALVAVLLIMGLLTAVMELNKPEPGARTADVPSFEAMQQQRTPLGLVIANPLIGAIGVLIGGRRARATKAAAA